MKKLLFTLAAVGVFAGASLVTINLSSEDVKTATTTPDVMDFEEWLLLATTTPDVMDFEEWLL
ncbi:MAG: hypothetical protein ACOCXH_11135 [Cyclobacteriaceae bacterium]